MMYVIDIGLDFVIHLLINFLFSLLSQLTVIFMYTVREYLVWVSEAV